ncbi:MAG: MGMT family protein [Marmoricola sp.]
MSERLTEVVLRIVEGIPVGLVASYGDLAATLDVSPRQVARVMSQSGSGVPCGGCCEPMALCPRPCVMRPGLIGTRRESRCAATGPAYNCGNVALMANF